MFPGMHERPSTAAEAVPDARVAPDASDARAADERREQLATHAGLLPLFEPRSVAVIGASRKTDSVGALVLRNLRGGFSGPVYPVNPHAESVQALPAFASLRDVPGDVDLAIVVVPAAAIPAVLDDCRDHGVKAVIVLSAGFAETGPEGRALQGRVLDQVRAAGIRLVGPNCLGVINTDPAVRLNATFASTPVRAGGVAMSSQSGALGVAVLEYAQSFGIGFSSFVSVGNKADVSGNDLLQYWEDDPRTAVILLYLESFGNPRRFARIARRVARKKPVLAVKSGRSTSGRRAASSHTAALAGSEAGSDALCRQAGVLRCNTLEELFEVAALLAHQPLPKGPRVAVVTNAGGPGILCADACEVAGLMLPALDLATVDALQAFLPGAASLVNPVDMIATAGPAEFERAVPLLLDDPNVDALIAIHIPVRRQDSAGVEQAIARGRAAARAGRGKPILACLLSERSDTSEGAAAPARGGPRETIPVYRFPESAARALGAAWERAAWLAQAEGVVPALEGVQAERARAICRQALETRGECWLRAEEVSGVLAAFGIPTLPIVECRTGDETAAAARRFDGPVAVKLLSDTLVHKTEVGGVVLGVTGADEAQRAFDTIARKLALLGREAEMRGVSVQPMGGAGLETMLGFALDPDFGPLVAFGLGGTTLELFGDVVFRITPLTDRDASEMLASIRGRALLDGFRSQPAADKPALIDMLLRVSRMAEEVPELAELDLNPVLARPPGQGAVALDARMHVRRPAKTPR